MLQEHGEDSAICRAIRAVRNIETAGGEVIVARADAADSDQMERGDRIGAITLGRNRWSDPRGGHRGKWQARLLEIAMPTSDSVLSPKTAGLAVLTRLLGARPLDFVVLMSSINAVLGAPGSVRLFRRQRRVGRVRRQRGTSRSMAERHRVRLGGVAGGRNGGKLVVPESRRALWEENVRSGIPSSAGIEVFSRVLAAGARRVVVSSRDLGEMFQLVRSAAVPPDHAAAGATAEREPAPETALNRAIGSPTEASLAGIWSELLGVGNIDLDADFFELGGHSLLATRMMSRIHEIFGTRVSLRDVFDAPTTRKLAARINSARGGSAPDVSEDMEEREELIF